MNTFTPDLIIEITQVCNRACAGCYAPNVVTKEGAKNLYETQPELFLSVLALNNALNELERLPETATIRGGEPSLHPKLSTFLRMAGTRAKSVFLETHARWLLPDSASEYQNLIESIQETGTIVKISFDKMHRLKADDLYLITSFLTKNGIDFRIAITEASLADYMITRSLCSWVDDEKIIFQFKATNESDLVKPLLGTINTQGKLKETVTHKFLKQIPEGVVSA